MVPFVYLASVCRSLQCLISTLTQASGGGLLLRFACSVVRRGGRGTADKCHWRVWGALAVFRPHWACPSRVCASLSTLLRLQAALQGAGPAWRAVPVFRYSTKAQIRLGLCFVPSPPEQLRPPGAWRVYSPRVRCAFSPPWSQPQFPRQSGAPCVSSGELISGCDPPCGCQ